MAAPTAPVAPAPKAETDSLGVPKTTPQEALEAWKKRSEANKSASVGAGKTRFTFGELLAEDPNFRAIGIATGAVKNYPANG